MPVADLYCRQVGSGPPLLLLHGLFGSADNVGALARQLAPHHTVLTPDMRNHGRSPHLPGMQYREMAEDVRALMDRAGLETCPVFGHSMGGKAAMQLALMYPERVSSLIVGDISPVRYPGQHTRILEGMAALYRADVGDRQAASKMLAPFVEEGEAVIQFLLTNWRRSGKRWGWRLNLEEIIKTYDAISDAPDMANGPYQGQALFLKGGQSHYIQKGHWSRITALFAHPHFRLIEGTGHWLHAEKPALIGRQIARFLTA